MQYLVTIPISREEIFTIETTLDQLAIDSNTCMNIEDIEKLKIGEYIIIKGKFVVIRID